MIAYVYQLLAKIGYTHPIHPTEVHMPIGLVIGALIFALAAVWFRRDALAATPRHCIILAFIWIFPTILFGFMDWQYFYGGAWLLPIKVKLAAASLLAILLLAAIPLAHRYGSTAKRVLAIYVLCFCCVVVLGYFGGELVYGGRPHRSSGEFKAGAKIYTVNCGTCHPDGGNVIDAAKPVINSATLKTFDDFDAWIRHPQSPMPAFSAAAISEDQAKELYQYIVNVLDHPVK